MDKGIKGTLGLLFANVIYSSCFYSISQKNNCTFACKANLGL